MLPLATSLHAASITSGFASCSKHSNPVQIPLCPMLVMIVHCPEAAALKQLQEALPACHGPPSPYPPLHCPGRCHPADPSPIPHSHLHKHTCLIPRDASPGCGLHLWQSSSPFSCKFMTVHVLEPAWTAECFMYICVRPAWTTFRQLHTAVKLLLFPALRSAVLQLSAYGCQ